MADSPIFTPPMNRITDNDPQISRVPQDKTDWGFRPSQKPPMNNEFPVSNLTNGK